MEEDFNQNSLLLSLLKGNKISVQHVKTPIFLDFRYLLL